MPVMRPGAPVLAALLLPLLLGGCGASETPESRVRRVIAGAERAVEERSLTAVRDLISEAYTDESGYDKRTVLALLNLRLRQHDAIHLLVQPRDLSFPAPDRAEAVVLVAMAGREIDSLAALTGVSADLYRFDIVLAEEDGEWRLLRAAWRRAGREDFL
jgi:hypothetical protein